jgi:hypothetical protein
METMERRNVSTNYRIATWVNTLCFILSDLRRSLPSGIPVCALTYSTQFYEELLRAIG